MRSLFRRRPRPMLAPDPLELLARDLLDHRASCGVCAFCVGGGPSVDEAVAS